MDLHILHVSFGGETRMTVPSRWKIDYGQKIQFDDLELPEYFECHFANTGDAKARPYLGHNNVVEIPNIYLEDGRNIDVYIYNHETENDGETVRKLTIVVNDRPELDEGEVPPEQESIIEQAIAALEAGLAEVEEAASLLENPGAQATTLAPGSEASASYENGVFSFGIPRGDKGNPGEYYMIVPSANVIVKNKNTGTITPSQIVFKAYKVVNGDSTSYAPAYLGATIRGSGMIPHYHVSYQDTLTVPVEYIADTGYIDCTMQNNGTLASIIIPCILDGEDGFSPTVSTQSITGGNEVTFTDKNGDHVIEILDGEDGVTPQFTVGTTETLSPGSNATVTQTGTPENPVLNFGIPRGEDGDDAVYYLLEPSVSSLIYDPNTGTIDPTSVTFVLYRVEGGTKQEYSAVKFQVVVYAYPNTYVTQESAGARCTVNNFHGMDGRGTVSVTAVRAGMPNTTCMIRAVAAGLNGTDGNDGFDPVIATSAITGGHQVSLTDATHTETFNVLDGEDAVIDATLSHAGEAADAKATGDALSQLNSAITELDAEINGGQQLATWSYKGLMTAYGLFSAGNGATSTVISYTHGDFVSIGTSARAVLGVYSGNTYLGKIGAGGEINKTGGDWYYFTGSIDLDTYVGQDSTADGYVICVMPTDSTTLTDETFATWANTKISIQKAGIVDNIEKIQVSIAPVEDGSTVSQAYAKGDYFYHGGDLCKAKTAITSGAQITVGTNTEYTSVADELKARTPKLLWENPSPSSEFQNQTLTISGLTNYTHIMVETYFSTTWQYSFNQIFRVGVNGVLFANTGDTMARRTLTFSGNDIAVSMSRRGSDDNYVTIIPSRIYGLNF